jgi:tetratricopeptide (TPR) repeat protein
MLIQNPRFSKYLNFFLLVVFVAVCGEPVFGDSVLPSAPVADKPEVSEAVERAAALYEQFKTRDALDELQTALKIDPDNLEALVWSARAHVDLGDLIPPTGSGWQERRKKSYRKAEEYAQMAATVDPNSTWAHFYIAVAMGKIAALSSVKEQIALAHEIRARLDKSIALDPGNGYAYHVLGVWHRRMAEIGKTKRFMALVFLQGSVPKGTMDESIRYLKKAISYNPRVITHHLELAKTYKALGKRELAEKHLKTVQRLPVQFSDDRQHKQDAKILLETISQNGAKETTRRRDYTAAD